MFKTIMGVGMTLAILGVVLQIGMLAVLTHYTFFHPSNIDWIHSFVLGTALSSTDPVAVVAVLKSLRAPARLSIVFDAESLINDGVSVSFFNFFILLVNPVGLQTGDVIWSLFRLMFLGAPFGLLCAIIIFLWLTLCKDHDLMQIVGVVTGSYLSWFIGEEYLGLSGPMTVVAYGLFINAYGHVAMEPSVQKKHHEFVEAMAILANTGIFVISGVLTGRMMVQVLEIPATTPVAMRAQWWHIPVLYIYVNLARAIMTLILSPVLLFLGYGMGWKEIFLLAFGGLRGAIVLALALIIEEKIDPTTTAGGTREVMVLYIAAIVMLMLILNGILFDPVYRLLNPYPAKPFRKVYLERTMRLIDNEFDKKKAQLLDHWLFGQYDVGTYGTLIVPAFSGREMDRNGRIADHIPNITAAMRSIPDDMPTPPIIHVGAEGGGLQRSESSDSFDRPSFDAFRGLSMVGAVLDKSTGGKGDEEVMRHSLSDDDDDGFTSIAYNDPDAAAGRGLQLHRETTLNSLSRGESLMQIRTGSDIRRYRSTASIEFFEMPSRSGETDHKQVLVLRKEREGELYHMVFNAVQLMYKRLCDIDVIRAHTSLRLVESVEVALDYTTGVMKKDTIKVWQKAISESAELEKKKVDYALKRHASIVVVTKKGSKGSNIKVEMPTPFEVECAEVYRLLYINATGFMKFYVNLKLRIPCRGLMLGLSYHYCLSDIEKIMGFVDVHRELLEIGGTELRQLMGTGNCNTYQSMSREAQHTIEQIKMKYGCHLFNYAIVRVATSVLLNMKEHIIDDYAKKGLLLEEDLELLLSLVHRQRQELLSWRPFNINGCCGCSCKCKSQKDE
eukprot:GHVU01009156.1.p1 GENE.GHVU01009156.1~~GHVU01009156.1.p1  ORF type:complete len:840 (-),score=57.44 GHVU01009156.1:55-2574(-)